MTTATDGADELKSLFDPDMAAAMARMVEIVEEKGLTPPPPNPDPIYVRERMEDERAWWNEDLPEMAEVLDRVIPGPDGGDLPIRSYRPPGAAERPPVIVYLHGGGWTIGDLETHDEPCRALAAGTGAVVISVDYRLAPEHRFPDALDDAYAAVCFVADNADELGVDVERLVVAGDSAGGNLAAVVSLMARDRSGPAIALQVLIYPAVDFDYDSGRWPSLEENATGYFLHLETMRWFADCYGDIGQLAGDPLAAPIGAADHTGLPPAHVSVAGFDPLRDEGLGYAATLAGAGVLRCESLSLRVAHFC